jgi:thiamine-phosphate pyrophosphorylase
MEKIKEHSLYLIISEECGKGKNACEIAEAAIAGGVDIVQMREKDKPKEELILLGKKLLSLCNNSGTTFIVNDDPTLAGELGADGVHLGQEDAKSFPIKSARRIVGGNGIVGISTHSFGQFKKANDDDVDYIAFGPVFPTKTKDYSIGTKDVEKVLKIAAKPVFFIGGINLSNIGELLKKGAKNIALIRGITEATDVKAVTAEFKRKVKMIIKINGKSESISGVSTVSELISKRSLVPEHVVIEHNMRIVPKEEWDGIILNENDNVEIVSFVGGG